MRLKFWASGILGLEYYQMNRFPADVQILLVMLSYLE
jgi:hypothetical protein